MNAFGKITFSILFGASFALGFIYRNEKPWVALGPAVLAFAATAASRLSTPVTAQEKPASETSSAQAGNVEPKWADDKSTSLATDMISVSNTSAENGRTMGGF